MFDSLTLPSAALRWRLDGPAGSHLDVMVSRLIGAGCRVEPIAAGTAYRIDGPAPLLEALAAELTPVDGFRLEHEPAPSDTFRMSNGVLRVVSSVHDALRPQVLDTVFLHGAGVKTAIMVARAVDAGLDVVAVGVCRWRLEGHPIVLQKAAAAALGLPPPAEDSRFPAPPLPRPDVVLGDEPISFESVGWPDRQEDNT